MIPFRRRCRLSLCNTRRRMVLRYVTQSLNDKVENMLFVNEFQRINPRNRRLFSTKICNVFIPRKR